MSGLVMETITHCEYCRNSIEWNDVKIETRVVYPYNSLMQVTHRKCWLAVNNIVNTILLSVETLQENEIDETSVVP